MCHSLDTLRKRQKGQHFADDIFNCILLTEKCCVLIEISLNFFPKGPIDNNQAFAKIMAWRLPGHKRLPEPMMAYLLMYTHVIRPQWVNIFLCFQKLIQHNKDYRHQTLTFYRSLDGFKFIFNFIKVDESCLVDVARFRERKHGFVSAGFFIKLAHILKDKEREEAARIILKISCYDLWDKAKSWKAYIAYMPNYKYQVVQNRYSRLLFTCEDCLCDNLCVQEQLTNMTIWHHNCNSPCSRDITDQLWWHHNAKSEKNVLRDNGEIGDR